MDMKRKKDFRKIIVEHELTGRTIETFNMDLPAIRSLEGYLQGSWDLSAYNDCFGENNRLGDMDATIEIAGHFIVIEFKRTKSSMNKGQIMKAIRMAKEYGITTVFCFGATNKPEGYLSFSSKHPYGTGYRECTMESFKRNLKWWNDNALKNPKPSASGKGKAESWIEVKRIMDELGVE